MANYLYLFLNFVTILFPLLFSFYSKAPFYKQWKYLWIALLIPAAIFIIWDELFTSIGIWGFNPHYLTGVYILNLPLEEILFFICIPYACIFTYFSLNYLIKQDYFGKYQHIISLGLITILTITGIINYNKLYTVVTFIGTALFLLFQITVLKPDYMGRFYFSFLFTLIPFFIINGILTGSFIEGEVVWYNDHENMGIRIGTIPVEDIFYGMLLLAMNITIFEQMRKRTG